MPAFQVGTEPQQIYFGTENGEITLLNDGPFTVYLAATSGEITSPYNSYQLPPRGTMTWQSDKPLWAATKPVLYFTTADGVKSTLITSVDGLLAIPNAGISLKTLFTFTNNLLGDVVFPTPIEVSAYEAISLKIHLTPPQLGSNNVIHVLINWMDEAAESFIHQEQFYVYDNQDGSFGSTITVYTPTKGFYAYITIRPETTTADHIEASVIGHSHDTIGHALCVAGTSTSFLVGSAVNSVTRTTTYDGWTLADWDVSFSLAQGVLNFMPLGNQLTLYARRTGAMTGPPVLGITQLINGAQRNIGLFTLSTAGTTMDVYTMQVPKAYPLQLRNATVGTGLTSITAIFSDYK